MLRGYRAARRAGGPAAGAAVLACALSSCGLVGGSQVLRPDAPQTMTITSPAFEDVISSEYTCHGAGVSPPLYWSDAPAGTKSFALVVDDSAAPIAPYVYWVVFDIGTGTPDVPPGQIPPGARVADNSQGRPRYEPPCPTDGRHTYRFTVYALSSRLHLPNGVGLKEAWQAIAAHALARGRMTASAGGAEIGGTERNGTASGKIR
ncbi:MAG: YbhB/YbcL family Raf kinase inhibitor-like protein [Streptosporangiaceae bacterium]